MTRRFLCETLYGKLLDHSTCDDAGNDFLELDSYNKKAVESEFMDVIEDFLDEMINP